MITLRRLAILVLLPLLAACSDANQDLAGPVEPLGAFKLGHVVVVADNARMVPPSRRVSEAELETAMNRSLTRRFERFDGDQFYHVAVSIEGYSLAVPGVPLVLNPKSVMVIYATIWDDAKGGPINTEPYQITVLERLSEETAVGSGLTQNKQQQLQNLTDNAARLIENWMRENEEWFAPRAGVGAGAAVAEDAAGQ